MPARTRQPSERGQLDLFHALPGDFAPRDAQDLMAYPFFSLAKSKRTAPIDFRSGDVAIRVEAMPDHGMATIWDADILIWAASQIVNARDAGLRTSRLMAATPYEMLTYIGRGISKRDYLRLKAALDRLQSTSVVTSLRQPVEGRRHRFSWINEWQERTDANGRPLGVELILPDWFYRAVAYTIKGFGLPLAGHKDNHAGLMTTAQVEELRAAHSVMPGREWEPFEGLPQTARLADFVRNAPFNAKGRRRYSSAHVDVPAALDVPLQPQMSTQQGFGLIMHEIGKQEGEFARRIVTTSPDVTVSTNLGAWVNRRGLFARDEVADLFRKERIPSTFNWDFSPKGQHIELGIAEMNLFVMLSALGLSHSIFGERLLPIGTLYDPFIERGLDALNYACYQDARFIVAATPSGVTLAPEGGAHQSIATPLIGMAQDGLASFEPAFVDELATIMRFSFDYIQRSGETEADEVTWLRDAVGGSVYLRLSTRSIQQLNREIDPDLSRDIVNGGYWMRNPGPNAEVVVIYAGAVAPEAIEAVGLMGEDRRDVGLLAVTSADRLNAGWTAAQRARERGLTHARSHIERLLDQVPTHCTLITVMDGHPATLAWMGSVHGHRTRALGVEHFGQTGTIADLYRCYGIDAQGIARAAEAISGGRPIRYLGVVAV